MLAERLRRLGYQTLVWESAAEALSAFSAKPLSFDIIITDHVMPHMTGIELIHRLRQSGYAGPAILATGCIEDMQEELQEAQPAMILMKPVQMPELLEALQTLLSGPGCAGDYLPTSVVEDTLVKPIGQAA